ncbi:MAG: DNA polymerase III subunit alpha, partial [Spirochaetales bacterium]|nr:DNA polymerase III subunit alpha [Candidatus Physcosoma equi]
PPSKYSHLILSAMSDNGYHTLMELNSIAWKEGYYYKPRIDDESLTSHSEDLICLSACVSGEIPRLIQAGKMDEARERILWFKNLFGDRYYLELQDHGLDDEKTSLKYLPQLAKELDVPLVCTNDIHYINKDDWNAHDTLICIGTQSKKNDKNRMRYKEGEFYFRSPEEMEELFSWCPEAIENTGKLADRCNLEIKFPGPVLPKCQIPPQYKDDAEYLTALSYEGLTMRYPDADEEKMEMLKKRLQYELDIIIKMDFPAYFLIVRDYIHWAKTHGIPVGPGRGSGAGSLVAYTTTITDVDPIKYNLLFERFLNPERVSLPDFDVDFCFERRGEVIDYVTEHYGHDSVGQITTFGTLKPKAVMKDVCRVLDIPFEESNKITALVPDEIPGLKKWHLPDALKFEPKLQEIRDRGGIYEELFDTCIRLEGLNRHTSLHAAGVVIGRETLDKYVPLCVPDPKSGGLASQYTMLQIEECGLVKMDFLGLKTLTLLKHAVDLIHRREPDFDLNKISDTDKPTFDMLCRGDSSYVFQFESTGMQDILKQAQPSTIEELVALNALYRPGPMQFIPKYIDSKWGRTPITYPDPALEPILKTTYGVIVYQEQVMQTAQIIAGYSLGEADILRRIMGKKKVEALAKELVKFKDRAVKLGHTPEHAEEIFHHLEPFAGYGFNKSHAVAYSVVAYQTAFLKANYNTEFLAANLTNEMGSPDKFKEYLNLAPKYGIRVVPPSINRSETEFSVDKGEILYGLAGIKNVGSNVADSIIAEREKNGPYKSFMDFLSRQGESSLNSRLVECLIKTGCFDELGVDRAVLLANLEEAFRYDKAQKAASAYGQLSLFGGEDEDEMGEFEMRPAEPFPPLEKLQMEKELLGFYISGHPLDTYQKEITECVKVNLSDPDTIPWGQDTQIVGQVIAQRVVISKKNGSKLLFLTIQTKDGDAEAVIFPKSYEVLQGRTEVDGIYGFIGKFEKRDDKLSFIINDVVSPQELKPEAVKRIHVRLHANAEITKDGLRDLMRLMMENEGNTPVTMSIDGIPGEELNLKSTSSLAYSRNLYNELKTLDVVEKVWVS